MMFEQIRHGGCLSYLIGCGETRQAIVVDPTLEECDHYIGLAAEKGYRIRRVVDTHTHADHFTAARELGRQLGVPVAMHRSSAAPFIDLRVEEGDTIIVGDLRIGVIETPGHTSDSVCLVLPDRVLTGDTLLIGGTGRTDLPTGDPEALYDSLFGKLARLDPGLQVFPAHDYKGRSHTTLGAEWAANPRLQQHEKKAFVQLMRGLDIAMPQHLSEALRTNRTGGKTVKQMIAEAGRAIAFMSMNEVKRHIDGRDPDLILLDVRDREAFRAGHLPGAHNIPRGELELRADRELPDPTARILTYCQLGKISTLAAHTLRSMGYLRAVALDGGLDAWKTAGYGLQATDPSP